jgi:glutamate 5-kinase
MGAAYVNEGAEKILLSRKGVSLLPVGVTKLDGLFRKGDIIEVRSENKWRLGFGIAQYGVEEAQAVLGKKGARALIHCDYLFIG